MSAPEQIVYIEGLALRRQNDLRSYAGDGVTVPPVCADTVWLDYRTIAGAPSPTLVANSGQTAGGSPVELITMRLTPSLTIRNRWVQAASQPVALPSLPPNAAQHLTRVVPPTFGDAAPPGNYAFTLTTEDGRPIPYNNGADWVVDSINYCLDFVAAPSPPGAYLDLRFYRYTGAVVAGLAPSASLRRYSTQDGQTTLGPNPAAGGMASFVVPPPAQSTEGAGNRFMFIAADGCVRGGVVSGEQWDGPSRGSASVAFGEDGRASGDNSAVIGGVQGVASEYAAAVLGGISCVASGHSSTCAGYHNEASGKSSAALGGYSVVASGERSACLGGWNNSADGLESAAIGGRENAAQGDHSVVLGGTQNQCAAAATASVAAGTLAVADYPGCFVWSDRSGLPTTASNSNQFMVGCAGGARFYSGGVGARSIGVSLPSGASAWGSLSDRNAKENLAALDSLDTLARVEALPIYEFNYIGTDPGLKCRGPMAQDWHLLFPSSKDALSIDTLDLDGITLAALKGLIALVRSQAARIDALENAFVEAARQPAHP
jgi:hypothetical protein